jgi:cation diffusion facilitator CzcD-associated flavoprotein CzcO
MDVDFWTRTSFEGGSYDDVTGRWAVRLRMGDGTERVLHPRHIVMATSVSGVPSIPMIEGIENFKGPVLHSSQFKAGREWNGRSVVVFGTGTSAHDICQELEASGARVTMVQRSPTMVVNVEPAQLYDRTYLGNGPPIEVRDIINSGVPLPVMKAAHKIITSEVRSLDAPLHARLEEAGFRLEFGEDGTGWPLKFRTRGGGYYFNVGCSDLIVKGDIALKQFADIDTFTADGAKMKDGKTVAADLVVLATGYKRQEQLVRKLFGELVEKRVGTIWGFGEEQELRNMYTRTGQPGLWLIAGGLAQCRIGSKHLALQIKAIEEGLLPRHVGPRAAIA